MAVDRQEFLQDVIDGLSKAQKTLPAKYFYDEKGSQLFEEICALDEYYITRKEKRILQDISAEVAHIIGDKARLIEPGAGSGEKAEILLQVMQDVACFVPVEISTEALQQTMRLMKMRFPDLTVFPMLGDFTDPDHLEKIPETSADDGRNLVFFPGSTIGNFDEHQATRVMQSLAKLAEEDGAVLLGVDLLKDPARLISAYDDAAGTTAAFNGNILERINRELDADFDVSQGFRHEARFNADKNRVEMHLVARHDQSVNIDGHRITFHRNESIHTENSHKYSQALVEKLAASADLHVTKVWMDADHDFGVFLLQP